MSILLQLLQLYQKAHLCGSTTIKISWQHGIQVIICVYDTQYYLIEEKVSSFETLFLQNCVECIVIYYTYCLISSGGYPNNAGPYPAKPGGISRNDCVVIDDFTDALCFAFRMDNSGPPQSVEVRDFNTNMM